MRGLAKTAFVSLFALQAAGCHEWVAVRPSELPKLNAGDGAARAERRSPARLARPDGSLLEIGRNAEVRVLTGEKIYEFSAPVIARIHEKDLWIQAGNTGKTVLPLSRVEAAEVSKFDGEATAAVIVVGVLGMIAITTVAVLVVVIPQNSGVY